MAKVKDSDWNGKQGSADMGDTPLVRENKNSIKTTDISKKVDPSWERTDGFSAKLDKGGE